MKLSKKLNCPIMLGSLLKFPHETSNIVEVMGESKQSLLFIFPIIFYHCCVDFFFFFFNSKSKKGQTKRFPLCPSELSQLHCRGVINTNNFLRICRGQLSCFLSSRLLNPLPKLGKCPI